MSTIVKRSTQRLRLTLPVIAACLLGAATAKADVITDWNIKANDVITATGTAKPGTPAAYRTMAIVQTATYDAVNAITKRYPATAPKLEAAPGASVDAAVAAANRAVLTKLVPAQQAAIDAAYQAALAKIADGAPKTAGIEVGERAAAAVLAARADDGAATPEAYRPITTAGAYVGTVLPVVPQWPQRRPWLMKSGSQFRPDAPPALTSATWARDYNEMKEMGSKTSTKRTADQNAMAQFWDSTFPPIYHGIVRSIATLPGREVTQNARLFAAVTQASDDALIAVFDAKYQYNFWRPITAIRNGDIDGNDATERDPSWLPRNDTPMHPEYPCAHCIMAGAIGVVLQAEVGKGKLPLLTTTSTTAEGQRSWKTIDAFVKEVENARIYGGLHFRNSTVVGTAMGKQIGALAVAKFPRK